MSKLVEFLREAIGEFNARVARERKAEIEHIERINDLIARMRDWLQDAAEEKLLSLGVEVRTVGEHEPTKIEAISVSAIGNQIPIFPVLKKSGAGFQCGAQIGTRYSIARIWLQEKEGKTKCATWGGPHQVNL